MTGCVDTCWRILLVALVNMLVYVTALGAQTVNEPPQSTQSAKLDSQTAYEAPAENTLVISLGAESAALVGEPGGTTFHVELPDNLASEDIRDRVQSKILELSAMMPWTAHTEPDFGRSFDQAIVRFDMTADASLSLQDLSSKLALSSSVADALEIAGTKVLLSILDPAGALSGDIPSLASTLESELQQPAVLWYMTGPCITKQRDAPSLDILSGKPDIAPFGDENGSLSGQEVRDWLSHSAAVFRRNPGCIALGIKWRSDSNAEVFLNQIPFNLTLNDWTRIEYERFTSLFLLQNADIKDIETYLKDCVYCPLLNELENRLSEERAVEARTDAERSLWNKISADTDPERLEIYVENCSICVFRDEAIERIEIIDAQNAVRDEEAARLTEILTDRDVFMVEKWLQTCQACPESAQAEDLVASAHAESALRQEAIALEDALDDLRQSSLQSWLDACEACPGEKRARAALAQRQAEAPCLLAAAPPQFGGPRYIRDIEVEVARERCEAALQSYPDSLVSTALLARIALAANERETALAILDTDMSVMPPIGHGILAQALLAGDPNDPEAAQSAESAALEGMRQGDWLSSEVLLSLYTRQDRPRALKVDLEELARGLAEAGNGAGSLFLGLLAEASSTANASDTSHQHFRRAWDLGVWEAGSFLAGYYEDKETSSAEDYANAARLYWSGLENGDRRSLAAVTDRLQDRPRAIVRGLQQKLREEFGFRYNIDGLAGPRTRQALEDVWSAYNPAKPGRFGD